MLSKLKAHFDGNIEYLCIGAAYDDERPKPYIDVQLILRKQVNKSVWFLDDEVGE